MRLAQTQRHDLGGEHAARPVEREVVPTGWSEALVEETRDVRLASRRPAPTCSPAGSPSTETTSDMACGRAHPGVLRLGTNCPEER